MNLIDLIKPLKMVAIVPVIYLFSSCHQLQQPTKKMEEISITEKTELTENMRNTNPYKYSNISKSSLLKILDAKEYNFSGNQEAKKAIDDIFTEIINGKKRILVNDFLNTKVANNKILTEDFSSFFIKNGRYELNGSKKVISITESNIVKYFAEYGYVMNMNKINGKDHIDREMISKVIYTGTINEKFINKYHPILSEIISYFDISFEDMHVQIFEENEIMGGNSGTGSIMVDIDDLNMGTLANEITGDMFTKLEKKIIKVNPSSLGIDKRNNILYYTPKGEYYPKPLNQIDSKEVTKLSISAKVNELRGDMYSLYVSPKDYTEHLLSYNTILQVFIFAYNGDQEKAIDTFNKFNGTYSLKAEFSRQKLFEEFLKKYNLYDEYIKKCKIAGNEFREKGISQSDIYKEITNSTYDQINRKDPKVTTYLSRFGYQEFKEITNSLKLFIPPKEKK